MSIEALWSIEFGTNLGTAGTGVIILETNRIFGGDANYYYVGNYKTKDNELSGEVEVTHFGGPMNSVFGDFKQFQLILKGTFTNKKIEMTGKMKSNSNAIIKINATRRSELP